MTDVQELKLQLRKAYGKRNMTIRNSWGNNEAYADYKKIKDKNKLESREYRNLINLTNKLLAEELLNLGRLELPLSLGVLKIYGRERKPKLVDGKLEYHAPIDWNQTIELWATDPEARAAKTIVKRPPGMTYYFKYHTTYRSFKNRRYIHFKVIRSIKHALRDKIINKENFSYVYKNLN